MWSPNYSIGVNVFFRLVSEAARLLENEASYGAWGWEIHHSAKKDAPSGTLLKLVEEMKQAGYARAVERVLEPRRRASRARTRSASTRRPTPSPCGIPRAAARASRAARSKRPNGWWARRASSSSAKYYFRAEPVGSLAVHRRWYMFTGCGTALVTPFKRTCRWMKTTLRRLVRRQIDAGINFLVPCGTTGESPTLDPRGAPARGRDHARRGRGQGARAGRRRRLQHRRGHRLAKELEAWASTASSR